MSDQFYNLINHFAVLATNPPCETLRPFTDSGAGAYGIAFTITSHFQVRWYAILSIIGYIVAICTFLAVLKWRYRVSVDPAFYFIFVGLPMILIGARLWSCIIGNSHWNEFFDIQSAGMAIQGGVVFGMLAGLIFFPFILRIPKYHKRIVRDGKVFIQRPSMWIYADAIIPTTLLGQAIGRWGNYFNGTIFGHQVSAQGLSWLHILMPTVFSHMQCVVQHAAPGLTYGAYYQPLFLYSSFADCLAFIVIYLIVPQMKEIRIGVPASLYFIFYGVIRFILESQRMVYFHFWETYLINAILTIIGLGMFLTAQFIAPVIRPYEFWRYQWAILRKQIVAGKINNQKWNWHHPVQSWIQNQDLKKYTRADYEFYNYANR